MGRISLNIELDGKSDRMGRRTVYVRLHMQDQRPARISTNVKIENAEQCWAATDKTRKKTKNGIWLKWVVNDPNADSINAQIYAEYLRIEKFVESCQDPDSPDNLELLRYGLSPRSIADRYKNPIPELYFELTELALEKAKNHAVRTHTLRKTAVNLLAEYAPDGLTLKAVTPSFLDKFQDYLRESYISPRTGKLLIPSSINQYMESLSAVHNEILRIKGHSGKSAALQSPFSKIDPLPAKSAYKSKFNEEDIAKIKKTKVESTRRRVTPEEAFSLWMLSHLLAGARCSDILLLRYQNFDLDKDGHPVNLTYHMQKTGNRVEIPILEEAQNLLKRWWKQDAEPTDYLLPYLKPTEKYATYLNRDDLYGAPYEIRLQLSSRINYWDGQINKVLADIEKKVGLRGNFACITPVIALQI
ncbi:hypothetical protein GO730_00305 [Spirosoma sp. HMF3257]|uniref:Phage integrase SAM-like domain-containing protein n=1 Tax=Spirosoma telluris TaxID=2183553 RepID=A0A327NE53_9BACT|nr:hypothetical protein [Spirosoma telluris]RAI73245.1 hypothetical protein HMF3257_00295 [Spirosoma telluris]